MRSCIWSCRYLYPSSSTWPAGGFFWSKASKGQTQLKWHYMHQWWMFWLKWRLRMQLNVIRIVSCRFPWANGDLNAVCSFGTCLKVGLTMPSSNNTCLPALHHELVVLVHGICHDLVGGIFHLFGLNSTICEHAGKLMAASWNLALRF